MGDVNTSYVSDHTKWMDEQLAKTEWAADQNCRPRLVGQEAGRGQHGPQSASKVPQSPTPTT